MPSPMVQTMAVMATNIMDMDSARLRNMSWMAMNMIMPAMGENLYRVLFAITHQFVRAS